MKNNSSIMAKCPAAMDPEQVNVAQTRSTPLSWLRPHALARFSGVLAVLSMTALGAFPTLAVPPSNDDIASAVVVTEPLPFSDSVSTVEATTAADDPDCAGNGPTVWYAYTPSVDGWINANTFGSDYDTTLSAYVWDSGSLIQIGCNDDFFSPQSQLNILVTAGTTYYFMAGAFFSGPGGNLVFNVDVGTPPTDVNVMVTQPIVVAPSTGTATVQVQMTASAPVFIFDLRADLVQPTGRGNIVASASAFVFAQTDAYSATLTLKDIFSLKTRGTGFVGGKARLRTTVVYIDPALGFQVQTSDQEVQLRGSNGK